MMSIAPMNSLQLSHHVLAIRNSDQSLEFYLNVIGMTLLGTQACCDRTHYFLGFGSARDDNPLIPGYPHCVLEYSNFFERSDRVNVRQGTP
jgi:hypothetical protein